MAYNSHRLNDPNDAGGLITLIPQSSVFTNDLLQSVNGSIGTSHPPCPDPDIHCTGNWTTDNGSPNVFAEDIPMNFKGNSDTCGHTRDSGSSNIFINAGGNAIQGLPIVDVSEPLNIPEVAPGTTVLQASIHLKDEPEVDDGLVGNSVQESIDNGYNPNTPEPAGIDNDNKPTDPKADVPTDCTDIFNEITNYNFPPSFPLSPNFNLGQLTTNTALSRYSLRAQAGFTTNQLVCNLRQLCINVLEPLKQLYPNMFITSGFRHGTGRSQHERGQAADIQFSGFSNQRYWDSAKVVKDRLQYDQFILELGKSYWFHLSYVQNGRHAVLTRTKPGIYRPGLIRLV